MSWLSGLKPSTSESDLRENRRKKLEQERLDRLHRSQQREAQKRILLAAQIAKAEADQACKDLLNIDPDLFEEKESVTIPESEIFRRAQRSRLAHRRHHHGRLRDRKWGRWRKSSRQIRVHQTRIRQRRY